MYRRVLLPIDGSEGTDHAVDHAVEQAIEHDASLYVLHVVETDVAAIEGAEDALQQLEEAGERAVTEAVDGAAAAGVTEVEGTVTRGTPYRIILDYVDQYDIDLVVMGTHGRAGLERYLTGSVTEKVVRLAECPVLTVPMAEGSERT
ncbi:MAG: universal stress protein [Haloferacaceae archaeon]